MVPLHPHPLIRGASGVDSPDGSSIRGVVWGAASDKDEVGNGSTVAPKDSQPRTFPDLTLPLHRTPSLRPQIAHPPVSSNAPCDLESVGEDAEVP